jgi:hypothetical protein
VSSIFRSAQQDSEKYILLLRGIRPLTLEEAAGTLAEAAANSGTRTNLALSAVKKATKPGSTCLHSHHQQTEPQCSPGCRATNRRISRAPMVAQPII